jgi:predicted unusual protein kinase regulating ubiquinone biosynthesis (AarF/ABC1/UbiB family)
MDASVRSYEAGMDTTVETAAGSLPPREMTQHEAPESVSGSLPGQSAVAKESADAVLAETGTIPRASLGATLKRAVVVLSILGWFALRRVWGALTGGLSGPVALRLAFEKLGPIYIKLGQLIASGEALFPAAYSEEFRRLLDRVPAFSRDDVERIVREDLGKPVDALFASFDAVPMAAASIAQVHGATLPDGREVVVKVQRPGLAVLASADLRILRFFAWLVMKLSPLARGSNVGAFVDDFETNLRQELDFRHEAEAMREFNEVMHVFGNDRTRAPKVEDALTHARVLTMERFRGWRIDDVEGVRKSGYEPVDTLLHGIRSWFQTLILRGFFHGDVHAGNFMLLSDGRIGYLDFGIVGRFGEDHQKGVLEYVLGFQQRDFGRVADAMILMKTAGDSESVDRDALARDLEDIFAPLLGSAEPAGSERGASREETEAFQLKDLVPGMIRTGRTHGLRMPRELVLVTKQLVYLDRYSRAYGGDEMNVLTDTRLTNTIVQDSFVAMMSA